MFFNLPDPDPANLFTLKKKGREPPALQEDSRDSRDGDLLDSGDPDSNNFNDNDDNDNNKVDNHLGDINKQVFTQNVITAISALANTIKHHENFQIKVKKPDSFDGTNLQKLINFIFQCQLTFCASLDIYHNDNQKVSFTIIYLCRAALDFFKSYLIDPIDISN